MPLHLDALLAYAVTKESLQKIGDLKLSQDSIRSLGENLPLERAKQGDLWCWKASALMPDRVLGHEMRVWSRKTESEMIAVMSGANEIKRSRPLKFPLELFSHKIDTARGFLKNSFQFIPLRHVRVFTAYCVGDADRIYDLLQTHITHIGARGRTGFGKIAELEKGTIQAITVTENQGANEHWQSRVLPWEKEGYVPIQAANKAPYWATENRTVSYISPSCLA